MKKDQKRKIKGKTLQKKVAFQNARDYAEGNKAVSGQSGFASAVRQNNRSTKGKK